MFVKIERLGIPRTQLYQCERVTLHWLDDEAKNVLVDMEGSSNVAVEIEKPGTSVYMMNDHGRTIDSYVWPPLEPQPTVAVPVMAIR